MSTPTKEATEQTYELSDEERQELIENEVESLSNTLGGYQMNSEMKTAWVTSIVPPNENVEGAPRTDEEIAVEFMLPSEDVFWETFDFPNMRWPEDNEFRQFVESMDVYSPENISRLIRKEADVEFSEQLGRWTVEGEFGADTNSQDITTKSEDTGVATIVKFGLAVVGVPLILGSMIALRQYSLVFIIPMLVAVYIIFNSE